MKRSKEEITGDSTMNRSIAAIATTLALCTGLAYGQGSGCPVATDCAGNCVLNYDYVGDGYCDGDAAQYGENWCCIENDQGDCTEEECAITNAQPDSCEFGVLDCAGNCQQDDSYVGDGYCDGDDALYGENWCCQNNDGGDCTDEECAITNG
ncbi:MAG: hypothetical protein VXY94_05245, partial [Planctomycetota bacterium]|nr:hypothetical protein [Planctomycetota bacterium]